MALQIQAIRLIDNPGHSQDLLYGYDTHTAQFRVRCNEDATAADIVNECQNVTIGGDIQYAFPVAGDTFDITTPDGNQWTDPQALASSITHRSRKDEGTFVNHIFEITWERPRNDGDTTRPPLIPPDQRVVEQWVEWETESVPRDYGKNRQKLGDDNSPAANVPRAIGTNGPVCNAAGDVPQDLPYKMKRRPVICYQIPVANPFNALQVERDYRNTYNSSTWNGFAARHAVFHSADAGRPLYFQNTKYHNMEVRITVFDQPDYIRIPNIGTHYVWAAAQERFAFTTEDGWITGPGTGALALNGDKATGDPSGGVEIIELEFEDHTDKDYSGLEAELLAYRMT